MPKSRPAARILACLVTIAMVVPATTVAQDGGGEVFQLTLDDALRIALENNLDLVSAVREPEIAEQGVVIEDALYDFAFDAQADRNESRNRERSQATQTESSNVWSGSVGMSHRTRFGASYSFGLGTSFQELQGGLATTTSFWSSGVDFSYDMPLLRGLGHEVETESLLLARGRSEISRLDLFATAQQTLETVEGAYWDVLAAGAALRIARLSLKRAQDLLELNRKKVEVGTLAPIEITQAEAGVASQEEGVIVAETTLLDAEDELRRLLAIPDGDARWGQSIAILDRPDFDPRDVDLDAALEMALANRPELAAARQRLRDSELSERVAKRSIRHDLSFTAGFRPTGFSGDEFAEVDPGPPPVFEQVAESDFAESMERIVDLDNYSWNAGLVYTVPIGNRAAKASARRASLDRERTSIALDNQEQSIRVEVRRAVRAVDSGGKRVEAARVNLGLQQKKLEAEQKKFENGMSTSFEVLTFQNDLADAELSDIRARLDYLKALAALERAKGTLLEARGLSID